MSDPDPDVRARIDARVAEVRRAAESKGRGFRIVEESATEVVYETQKVGRGFVWRQFAVSADGEHQIDGDEARRRARRRSAPSETKRRAAEERWIGNHSDLIEALRDAGHVPHFRTNWHEGEGGAAYGTTMTCDRCGSKYQGLPLRRWWGLSPRRPCDGAWDE